MSRYFYVSNYRELLDAMGIVSVSILNMEEQEREGVDIDFRIRSFECGKSLVPTLRPQLKWMQRGEILPVTRHMGGWVADSSVANALKALMPECVQLFETESESEDLRGLWILNFPKTLDCFDHERSSFGYSGDRIATFESVRFKEEKIGSDDQVFYGKNLPLYLFCTATGRKNMIAAGFDKRFFTNDYFSGHLPSYETPAS